MALRESGAAFLRMWWTVSSLLLFLSLADAQGGKGCEEPDASTLSELIQSAAQFSQSSITVVPESSKIVCLASSGVRENYAFSSAIANASNSSGWSGIVQVDFECNFTSGSWIWDGMGPVINYFEPLVVVLTPGDDLDYLLSPTTNLPRKDCYFCIMPEIELVRDFNLSPDATHCVACNPNCTEGLQECVFQDFEFSTCCAYHLGNGSCVDTCVPPMIVDPDTNECDSDSDCPGFYTGPDCTTCGLTCENNGTIANNSLCDTCYCTRLYTGPDCSELVCDPSPCLNDGNCSALGNSTYFCNCPYGFTGDNCELLDGCADDPCLVGSRCNNFNGTFNCTCLDGCTGFFCNETIPGEKCPPDTAFKCETLCRAFIGAIFGCVAILGVVIGLAILCVCIEKKKEGNKEELEESSSSEDAPIPLTTKDITVTELH